MARLVPEWQRVSVLEAVFDQLSDALILYDKDFLIAGVNSAAEKMFAMTAEQMVGRECRDVFRCDECEPGCGMLVGLSEMPSLSNSTIRLHTDNGRERLAIVRTRQLNDEAGHITGAVASIKEIGEEELRKLCGDL